MVQLLPLQEPDPHTIADKFFSMVVSQHRLQEYIISDHDPHFCGHFWDELMSLLDTIFTFSMAAHPQTDGMAQVKNHTME